MSMIFVVVVLCYALPADQVLRVARRYVVVVDGDTECDLVEIVCIELKLLEELGIECASNCLYPQKTSIVQVSVHTSYINWATML